MNDMIAVEPVRKRVRVNVEPARAFEIFTTRMSRWWPPQHSIGRSPIKEVMLEPFVGGLWGERGEDGAECVWGKVLEWEPPARLVLAWQIGSSWQFDPDLVTELEVRFAREGNGTLLELEHRLDGYGPAAEQMRERFDGPMAWEHILERYGKWVAEELFSSFRSEPH